MSLSLSLYIYIYIYMYTCIYIYIYTHVCVYIHTYIHIHVYTYMHIYIHTCFFWRDAHFRRRRAPSEVTPRWKLRQLRQREKLRQSPSPRTLRTRRDTRATKARDHYAAAHSQKVGHHAEEGVAVSQHFVVDVDGEVHEVPRGCEGGLRRSARVPSSVLDIYRGHKVVVHGV